MMNTTIHSRSAATNLINNIKCTRDATNCITNRYTMSPSTNNPSTTKPVVTINKVNKINENGTSRNTNQHNQTLLLLDFDDTLYPSTYIKNHHKNINMTLFKLYCHKSYKLLSRLITKYGAKNIYIITNADSRWITKSLNYLQHCPVEKNIAHLIVKYKIKVYSAKDQFATKYPNDCIKWKQAMFKYLIRKHYNKYIQQNYNSSRNNEGEIATYTKYNKFVVVTIGDGIAEYVASYQAVKEVNNNIILHRIRLLSEPSLALLCEQYGLIQLLSNVFDTELDVGMNINYKQEMSRHSTTNRGSSSSAKSAKPEKQTEGEKQYRCHNNLNDHKQKIKQVVQAQLFRTYVKQY